MPQQLVLRKMQTADVLAVHAIDCATSVDPWSVRLFQDCVNVGYECWVVVDAEDILGFGIISYAVTEAHILNFAIHPKHHRLGLGQKLLQHLLTQAKSQGSQEVFLEVRPSNTPARALYKKFHFVEVGIRKDYYVTDEQVGKREDAITLALPLF